MTDPTEARRLAPAIPTSRQERVERWGDGPWIDEPDREEWREAGLPCLVRRIPRGSLCGYVAVPPGHPLHGKGYDEIEGDVRVHSGLTYASTCHGEVCHVPEPGESDAVWWFGFDTGHALDYVPALWINPLRGGPYSPRSQAFAAEVRAEIDEPDDEPDGFRMRYRDFAYVRAQTVRLARQLAELAAGPLFIGVDHAAIRAGAAPRNSAEAHYLLRLREEDELRADELADKP